MSKAAFAFLVFFTKRKDVTNKPTLPSTITLIGFVKIYFRVYFQVIFFHIFVLLWKTPKKGKISYLLLVFLQTLSASGGCCGNENFLTGWVAWSSYVTSRRITRTRVRSRKQWKWAKIWTWGQTYSELLKNDICWRCGVTLRRNEAAECSKTS